MTAVSSGLLINDASTERYHRRVDLTAFTTLLAGPSEMTEQIEFQCEHCGKRFVADAKYAGRKSKCVSCKQPVRVPEKVRQQRDAEPPELLPVRENTDQPKLRFECSNCGTHVTAPAGTEGRKARCPGCKQIQIIPNQQSHSVTCCDRPQEVPGTKITEPLIGVTDAVCPYCDHRLQKMPGRKKKCPACENSIFVRTRPRDKVKILVREDQLLAINEQWSIVRGTHEQFLMNQRRRQTAVKNYESTHAHAENQSDSVSEGVTSELTNGLRQGMSPREVARNISERVEGFEDEEGKKRAHTIARTETIRALAEGQLDSLEKLGIDEVTAAVEWSTSLDEHVCPLCKPLEGIVLKLKEARGMLPRHENCRCSWRPANVGESKEGQKRTKGKIEKAIDLSIKAEIPEGTVRTVSEQKGLTSWVGANKKIAKKRPKDILDL